MRPVLLESRDYGGYVADGGSRTDRVLIVSLDKCKAHLLTIDRMVVGCL
jgi:hypothetical protein